LHLPLCMAVCLPLRLDLVIAYLAAHISNPVLAPVLLAMQIDLGSLVLTGRHAAFDVEQARATGVSGFVSQAVVGSLLLGGTLAAAGGGLAAALARRFARPPTALQRSVERTVERYRQASRPIRRRVAQSVRYDPLLYLLASRAPLGVVLQVPSRFGQLGLALVDCGAAEQLVGFDPDPGRVRLARAAAQGQADFQQGDLRLGDWPMVDTILLIDALHWVPHAQHEPILARATRVLQPDGRIVLRELDAARGLASRLAALAERLDYRWQGLRLGRLSSRTAADWIGLLEALGLDCELVASDHDPSLVHFVVVATKAPG
jgi:SAM-dependent methyltransferase